MRFEHETTLAHPREQVFAWHERPGAIVRLTPPALGRVESEPTDGLRDGSTAVLRMSIPGTVGALGVKWTARHGGYRPPERFEDEMVTGPMKAWHHTHRFRQTPDGGTVVHDEIDLELPPLLVGPARTVAERIALRELSRVWAYRDRQLAFDLGFHARHTEKRRIAITGATGMIGTQLTAFLRGGGHDVRRITRREPVGSDIQWDPAAGRLDPGALRDVDVVIHLAGENIGKRFTAAHKRRVMDSRRDGTALVSRTLAALADDGHQRALISASASGYYGADPGDEVLREDHPGGSGFVAEVCRQWEQASRPARDAGVRVVNVRTGIVQSAAGGQLQVQAPIFRLGGGGPLGDGKQWMPWIAIDDLVGIYAHAALHDDLAGPVNACAPGIVRNKDYAKVLARVLHRPALLPVPRFGPRALFNKEGVDDFVMAGQRMSSEKATGWGYRFAYPDLDDALRHVLAL